MCLCELLDSVGKFGGGTDGVIWWMAVCCTRKYGTWCFCAVVSILKGSLRYDFRLTLQALQHTALQGEGLRVWCLVRRVCSLFSGSSLSVPSNTGT